MDEPKEWGFHSLYDLLGDEQTEALRQEAAKLSDEERNTLATIISEETIAAFNEIYGPEKYGPYPIPPEPKDPPGSSSG